MERRSNGQWICINAKNWNAAWSQKGNSEAWKQSEAWSQHNLWDKCKETFRNSRATNGINLAIKNSTGEPKPKPGCLDAEKKKCGALQWKASNLRSSLSQHHCSAYSASAGKFMERSIAFSKCYRLHNYDCRLTFPMVSSKGTCVYFRFVR